MAGAAHAARLARQRGPLARSPVLARVLPCTARCHGAASRPGLPLGPAARPQRLPVPVVVVGNVVAGGGGKTPVVMALVRHLRTRGIAAGVVSRGYGRAMQDCREVLPEDRRRSSGRRAAADLRRPPACRCSSRGGGPRPAGPADAPPGHRVLVCDDGLQHHALARDIEICVFDRRGVGNGWLLPAGPLREPWPRPVDLVLQHGEPSGIAGWRIEAATGGPRRAGGRPRGPDGGTGGQAAGSAGRHCAARGLSSPCCAPPD
jgi:tetraacyldisaccharide-1-P 4'-kinase